MKETKKWWFGYNSKGDLGYVPSGLLSPSYDMELAESLADGIQSEEEERVEISEFSKADDDIERGSCDQEGQTILDTNSNIINRRLPNAQVSTEVQRTEPRDCHDLQRVPDGSSQSTLAKEPNVTGSEIYVSSEYISACVQNHEQKLVKELMYAQCLLPAEPTGEDDREWVFGEDMDTALLEEQIVPDVDMETDSMPLGYVSEVFQEDLWVEHNQSWNLPVASSTVSDDAASSRDANGSQSEGSRSSKESMDSGNTASTSTLSEAYDPVETYLRLCDCWSRPAGFAASSPAE